MRFLSAIVVGCGLLCLGVGSCAEQAKMPGEWKELSRSGITLLYQEDTRDIAKQVLDAAEKTMRDKPVPAVAGDWSLLARNKDKVAPILAAQLGLDAPTEMMTGTIDKMATLYERVASYLPDPHRIRLWRKETVKRLLVDGQTIPGFAYDKADDTVTFTWEAGANSSGTDVAPPDNCIPMVVRDDPNATPEQQTVELIGDAFEKLTQTSHVLSFGAICHEVAEMTITIEIGLQGPYRRWFCEGAATLAAERCVQEVQGSAALTRFQGLWDPKQSASLEPQADLIGWRAKEWDGEMPAFGSDDLPQARYAFSIAEARGLLARHDSDTLAKICKQIRLSPDHGDKAIYEVIKQVTGEDIKVTLGKYGKEGSDPFRGVAAGYIEVGECEWDSEGQWSIVKPGEQSAATGRTKRGVAFKINCAILDKPGTLRVDVVKDAGDQSAAPAATGSMEIVSEAVAQYYGVLGHDGSGLPPGPYRMLFYINDKLFRTVDLTLTGNLSNSR